MNTLLSHDVRNPGPVSVPGRLYRTAHHSLRVGSLAALDVTALLAAVVLSHLIRPGLLDLVIGPASLSLIARLKLFPVYAVIQLLLFSQVGLYGQGDRRRNYRGIAMAMGLGVLVLYGGSHVYPPSAHPAYLGLLGILGFALVAVGRAVVDRLLGYLYDHGLALSRVVIIGHVEAGRDLYARLGLPPFGVVGYVAPGAHAPFGSPEGYLGSLAHLDEILSEHRIQEVFLTQELNPRDLNRVHNACVSQGVRLHVILPWLAGITNPMVMHNRNGQHSLEIIQPRLHISQFALKRAFDFLSTLFGLILISPLMLAIALAIKLDSPGPVFFRQQRVTVKGKTFWMYKFRSMHVDAEAQLDKIIQMNERKDNLMFKMKRDPRVTRIGRLLRRTSLDELPQLLNVLRGEMSLVGPRPPLPREVDNYAPHHRQRLEVLPGITGLWQVSGRSDITDFEDVVRLDLSYIRDWSLLLDFKILAKTVPAVLLSKGAS